VKLALASLDQVWEDKFHNLRTCKKLILIAKSVGAELIVFPEMTLTGFSMSTNTIAESSASSKSVTDFKKLAVDNNIAIIMGVVFYKDSKGSNNAVFIDNNGQVLANYQKLHPFSFSEENKYYLPGDDIFVADFNSVKIGLTICYDLRFPELYSALSKNCELLVNIANWPKSRLEHWLILLKARAIENQVFVAGVNRIGKDPNGNTYEKSSVLVAPSGDVSEAIFESADLDVYDVQLSLVEKLQKLFPVKQDRRVDLYRRIL
jgi:predicted amidohydrolase